MKKIFEKIKNKIFNNKELEEVQSESYSLSDFNSHSENLYFINLTEKFKQNEFTFFLIYRFIGGIPFFISNILPTIFNVKIRNVICIINPDNFFFIYRERER